MLNLQLEFIKLKRRSFLLSLIAIVAVGLIWSGVVIKYELPKTHEAYNAIYTMTYLNDVILPLFIAVLASRLLELEHLGKTFKLLQTSNESPWQLFKAKLTVMAIFCLCCQFDSNDFSEIYYSRHAGQCDTCFIESLFVHNFFGLSLSVLFTSLLSFYLSKAKCDSGNRLNWFLPVICRYRRVTISYSYFHSLAIFLYDGNR